MLWRAEPTKEFNDRWQILTEAERRKVAAYVEILKEAGFYRQMVAKADRIYDAHLRRIEEEAARMASKKNREFKELGDELRKEPGAHEEIEARKAGIRTGMRLGELRRSRELTQVGLARQMKTSQANVSRMERSENPYLETLADFVGALGARLEINAVFEDEVVPLKVFEGEVETPTST